MPINFAGQVAIVTGAGGGIGEAIATELAKRGAAVVVNDYGGDVFGKASGTIERASECARKIADAGGRAVPDGSAVGTVASAKTIVETALRSFGRVDILINNAGFVGSGLIEETDEKEFSKVIDTHLMGTRALMREVWPRMRSQNYGRIVNVASSVAFGRANFSNFAAGKGGLIGLGRAAGLEGVPQNIFVNSILPTADTRATRAGLEAAGELKIRDWFIEHFAPSKVAQAAVYLASRELRVSGESFVVGGGRFARMGFAIAKGYFNSEITAEGVAKDFDDVMDFDGATIVLDNHSEQNTYLPFIPRPM